MSSPRLVQRLGLGIIALGLIAAAAVYLVAGADADGDADPVARQREMRELERLGGTASVQTVKFQQWVDSLWHGERLAGTLAVLGLIVGGTCWKIGELMAEEDLPDR
jgi:hypothetical protein